ncbi:hypothetical protein BJ165DRAFT_1404461 [Panaeolus papilionaceus]|nr:hypothetical protein BJ165DRAFT_1404461 [Panaeolus papilionaceus]
MYVILSLDPTTRLPGFLKADYGDSQDFRLVCRRVNSAVEPIARSKLTLDWDHSKGEFPLEQLQAYATPDKTGAPGRYVRHLTLRQMCVDYDAPTPLSFDYLLGPYNEANDGTETQHEVLKKARTGFVLQLLGKAISGFGKLETVTWKWSPCGLHSSLQPHVHKYCCSTIFAVGTILSWRIAPLNTVTIDMETYWSEIAHDLIPACKKLNLTGFEEFTDDWDEAHNLWLVNFVSGIRQLEYVDTDIWFNAEILEHFFPLVNSFDPSLRKIQHTKLNLLLSDYEVPDHVFDHFRSLRRLEVRRADVCDKEVYHTRLATFWRQLTQKKIYAEEIWIHIEDVQDAFIEYIASYPRPTLQFLELFRFQLEDNSEPTSIENVNKFFARALPVIAPGLTGLLLTGAPQDEAWAFDMIPQEFYPILQQCISLKELAVLTRLKSKKQRRRSEELICATLGCLPYLKSVNILEILDNDRSRHYDLPLRKQNN